MIKIGKPYIAEETERVYLNARIEISEDSSSAFRIIEKKMPGVPWRFYENYPPAEWKDESSALWFFVQKFKRMDNPEGQVTYHDYA